MPEQHNPGRRKHPADRPIHGGVYKSRYPSGLGREEKGIKGSRDRGIEEKKRRRGKTKAYAELRCRSNFSFLRGASHPDELADRAAELGYHALAVTDRNTLAGVVRMHCAAQSAGLKLIIGAEITPSDAPPIVLYAIDRSAYGRLARLITRGRLRRPKGQCQVHFDDIAELCEGLVGVVLGEGTKLRATDEGARRGHEGTKARRGMIRAATVRERSFSPEHKSEVERYRDVFGDRLYIAAEVHAGPRDEQHLAAVAKLCHQTRVPMVAANDVHYHEPKRRFLQDLLVCIREHCTITEAGTRLFPNGERYLKSPQQMARLFHAHPQAIARTIEIADRCTFSLDELRYEYPEELCPHDRTPLQYLTELTWRGAHQRYPAGVPEKVRRLIEHELKLIQQLRYEPYFLTVWDLVRFARSRGILCQGRGSAANSAVCYCIGITNVDPDRIDLLFERFVSKERNEPPDIDVDFEHERREEVFQYIYDKYDREHAGIVAEVITYRPRSAVRDVGKAMGLSLDRVDLLAKKLEWWGNSPLPEDRLIEAGLDPKDRTVRCLIELVKQIMGFPRHLSQHVGGFVITRHPLCELVPIQNGAMPGRTFIEWDKDDIDALGILKVDCLALGMMTAIGKCFDLVNVNSNNRHEGTEARRHEGAEEERDEGTVLSASEERFRRRHEEKEEKTKGKRNGDQDVSGSDCLAEGNGAGQASLSSYEEYAGLGAIWADDANATGSRVRSEQHRRGIREAKPGGLPTISSNSTRLPRRAVHPNDSVGTTGVSPDTTNTCRSTGGNGPCPSGPHPQPGASQENKELDRNPSCLPSPPSCLRALVPSCLSFDTVPPEDPAVYDMICRADTVGVFQIESRAQMSMLPRLKPRKFYDLVIEVAIVRPGPIQGGMVHPYLRRRNGEEAITYPNDAIAKVLHRTLGIPLFQEQAMKLAVVAAGFTPGEADQLRRAMGAWRRSVKIEEFRTKLIDGMRANGLSEDFAKRCFEQICGFGEYGFPESHAASFALLVYVSAWLKRYHPAAFTAALLNSQPMGFYAPAQLVRDAREHGVAVRRVDVNASGYDCSLEEGREGKGSRDQGIEGSRDGDDAARWGIGGPAVRLGMRLIKGISRDRVAGIEIARAEGPFTSIADLVRRSGVRRGVLTRLAAADAFRSIGLDRREALWQVLAVRDQQPPLFENAQIDEQRPKLPPITLDERVVSDYDTLGLSLEAHPISLIRDDLSAINTVPAAMLKRMKHGRPVRVAGLVLVRQRPATASGIVFYTLEDETGIANLIVRPMIYERCRRAARGAIALIAEGRVERKGEVIHVQVSHLRELAEGLTQFRSKSRDFR